MIDLIVENKAPFADQDKGTGVVKSDIEQPITGVLKQEPTSVVSNQTTMKPGKDDTTIQFIENITDKPFPGTPGAAANRRENTKSLPEPLKHGPDAKFAAVARQRIPQQKAA